MPGAEAYNESRIGTDRPLCYHPHNQVMGTYVLEIFGCLLAVGTVAAATAIAGRLAGLSLTAIASGVLVFILPPAYSFRVEDGSGMAAVLLNGLAGLVVASTVRPLRGKREPVERLEFPERSSISGLSMSEAIVRALESDTTLRARTADIRVVPPASDERPGCDGIVARVVPDALRIALSNSNVHHVDIHSSRRPDADWIRVVAEYGDALPGPAVRITGRADAACQALCRPEWPPEVSATWFDNGTELIYQIRIQRPN